MEAYDSTWQYLFVLGFVCIMSSPFVARLLPAVERPQLAAAAASVAQAKAPSSEPSAQTAPSKSISVLKIQPQPQSGGQGSNCSPVSDGSDREENSPDADELQSTDAHECRTPQDAAVHKASYEADSEHIAAAEAPADSETLDAASADSSRSDSAPSPAADQRGNSNARQGSSEATAAQTDDEFDFDSVLDELLPETADNSNAKTTAPSAAVSSAGQPQWLLAAAQRASAQRKGATGPFTIPASLQAGLRGLPQEQAVLWASVIQADSTAQLLAKPQPPLSNTYSSMQSAPRSAPSGAIVASQLDGKPIAPGSSVLQHLLAAPAGTNPANRVPGPSSSVESDLLGSALLCALQRAGVADDAGRPFVPVGTPQVEAGRRLGLALPPDMARAARRDVLLPMLRSCASEHRDVGALLAAGDDKVRHLQAALQQGTPKGAESSTVADSALLNDDALLDDAFEF